MYYIHELVISHDKNELQRETNAVANNNMVIPQALTAQPKLHVTMLPKIH